MDGHDLVKQWILEDLIVTGNPFDDMRGVIELGGYDGSTSYVVSTFRSFINDDLYTHSFNELFLDALNNHNTVEDMMIYFHKMHRQTSVYNSSFIDIYIWKCFKHNTINLLFNILFTAYKTYKDAN